MSNVTGFPGGKLTNNNDNFGNVGHPTIYRNLNSNNAVEVLLREDNTTLSIGP
jgi:hypothetical protein